MFWFYFLYVGKFIFGILKFYYCRIFEKLFKKIKLFSVIYMLSFVILGELEWNCSYCFQGIYCCDCKLIGKYVLYFGISQESIYFGRKRFVVLLVVICFFVWGCLGGVGCFFWCCYCGGRWREGCLYVFVCVGRGVGS